MPEPIADRATAVPAFAGWTAIATREAPDDLRLKPTRVHSLAEFEALFGGPHAEALQVDLTANPGVPEAYLLGSTQPSSEVPALHLYWSVRLYFDNGGGPCTIVSAGSYTDRQTGAALVAAIGTLATEDDVTLLAVPEASTLADYDDYRQVTTAILVQCGTVTNRFAILDVWKGYKGLTDTVDVAPPGAAPDLSNLIDASRAAWTAHLAHGAAYYPFLRTAISRLSCTPPSMITVTVDGARPQTLDGLATTEPNTARVVVSALADRWLTVPPSGAMAGIYVAVDATRGIWKAPANVAVETVRAPSVQVTEHEQAPLNVDVSSGKSINALRAFPGKGVLVWGARTLAGNDFDWRYIPVRRLASLLEASMLRSTAWAVLEPNAPPLWTRLIAHIQAYLTGHWQAGALLGTRPQDAFFVNCGLGTTMTQDDIDNGRLIVEVGVALTHPAEFVIIGFVHER